MFNQSILLRGTVLPDGSLQIADTVKLPPGPVEVVVRPVEAAKSGEDVLAVLARIRAEQQASGYKPRTAEEIDADIREMRDEWGERDKAIEALQEECRRLRENLPSSSVTP